MKEEFVNIPGFDSGLPFSVSLAGISYCDGSYYIKRCKSDCYCIEYIISGRGTIKTEHGNLYPEAGDIYLLYKGEDHYYYSSADEPWVKIWINFSGELVDVLIDTYKLRPHQLFHYNGEKYFRDIHATLERRDISSAAIMSRVAIIFHRLVQGLSELINKDRKRISSEALALKNYIDANINSQLSTEALASHIYKSQSQAIRIFKAAYGITPYEYYTDIRIKRAMSLLRSTGLSVKEIAYRLSFCDEHYFSNVFKKHTGRSPREYRES